MKHISAQVIAREDRPLFGLTPYRDESFFGFTARLAAWNRFDSRNRFLLSAGFPELRRQGLEAALEQPGRLAWLLRLTEEQLDALTGRTDPELAQYNQLLSLLRRRVSPGGLRREPYHRAAWAQKLPFCAESWELLIDYCPSCETKLGWLKVLNVEVCESCGFDLRGADAVAVPADQQKHLSLLASLVDRDPAVRQSAVSRFPSYVSQCSAFQIFELTRGFARAVARAKHKDKINKLPPNKQVACMASGVRIVTEYPASFDKWMTGENSALPEFFSMARSGAGAGCFAIYDKLYSDWEPCRHGPTRLRIAREERGRMTLRGAAKKLRLENRHVRQLMDKGLLGDANRRGVVRSYQWLDPEEVRDAAVRLAERMSLQEFSRTLGIPTRGAAQLIALGILESNDDPIVRELHPSIQLHRKSAEELARRFLALRRPPVPDVPLIAVEDVFHGIGGQEKPWGALLRSALAREIAIYSDHEHSPQLDARKLQIEADFARRLLARALPDLLQVPDLSTAGSSPDLLTRCEAESYLNCFPRDLSWLLAKGHLSDELKFDEVAALGQTIISSREITWRWRVSPALREIMERHHGIGRAIGPFWLRDAVEEYFAARFPEGRPV